MTKNDAIEEQRTPHSWEEVEQVISDLKNDGYEVADLYADTSGAARRKALLIGVER